MLRVGAVLEGGLVDHPVSCVGDACDMASGEEVEVEVEVASSFGPFIGQLGMDRADEADDRVEVGEEADAVGAAADITVQALVRVVRPDQLLEPLGELGERPTCQASLRSIRWCRRPTKPRKYF